MAKKIHHVQVLSHKQTQHHPHTTVHKVSSIQQKKGRKSGRDRNLRRSHVGKFPPNSLEGYEPNRPSVCYQQVKCKCGLKCARVCTCLFVCVSVYERVKSFNSIIIMTICRECISTKPNAGSSWCIAHTRVGKCRLGFPLDSRNCWC